MRISDWSSGVCSSDLHRRENGIAAFGAYVGSPVDRKCRCNQFRHLARSPHKALACGQGLPCDFGGEGGRGAAEFGPVAVADDEIGSNQSRETEIGRASWRGRVFRNAKLRRSPDYRTNKQKHTK